MKDISTLVSDIEEVVKGGGGWDTTINSYFSVLTKQTTRRRLEHVSHVNDRKGGLRMSNLGTPCRRKLWYTCNSDTPPEELTSSTKLKFLFGDILEDLLICLAKAAGHTVRGEQDELEVEGIKGHRDCVIDGVLIDIKSASSFSFQKFKEHQLEGYTKYVRGKAVKVTSLEADPFGYISQLSSYLCASQKDPLVTDKTTAGFLVIDKQHGHLCLDLYNLSGRVLTKDVEVTDIKKDMAKDEPPAREFNPVPDGKSGNMKLGTVCSYCHYKHECHPSVRTFLYSNGPRFLTKVDKVPDVFEVKQ